MQIVGQRALPRHTYQEPVKRHACTAERERLQALSAITGLPMRAVEKLTPEDASASVVAFRIAAMRDDPQYQQAIAEAEDMKAELARAHERGERTRKLCRKRS